jgi:hypothetical protein
MDLMKYAHYDKFDNYYYQSQKDTWEFSSEGTWGWTPKMQRTFMHCASFIAVACDERRIVRRFLSRDKMQDLVRLSDFATGEYISAGSARISTTPRGEPTATPQDTPPSPRSEDS